MLPSLLDPLRFLHELKTNTMEETQLPPGFRFHPTDEELITYYLSNKVSDFEFTTRAVADVDLNKCEPWDLPGILFSKKGYVVLLIDQRACS